MTTGRTESRRTNQRHRTRKDLLAAASRLLRERAGRTPTMDEIAEAAMVSRATAYRYFPTVEALLVEAPVDDAVPPPEHLFGPDARANADPVERAQAVEALLHETSYRNQAALRTLLAASIIRRSNTPHNADDADVPVRQNRRTPLIQSALAPARDRLADDVYANVCTALAIISGAESMIVCTDVLGIDEESARRAKSWAVATLVRAALAESAADLPPATRARRTERP